MKLTIDPKKKLNTLRGGIGASWHAIDYEVSYDNGAYDYPARLVNPRGSAIGGNPPVRNEEAWRQICAHASWLGINWLRVELMQHMYEPRRREFRWESEAMQPLYRILDWCEQQGADVFLQQMWTEVAWNAYPDVHPLISAPYSLDEYAFGIGSLLEYLTRERGYTCIKYFCITNEPPGGTWGYWWCAGHHLEAGLLAAALKRVRGQLDSRGIAIPLSGPDWTDLPPFDEGKPADIEPSLGALDIHSYTRIDEKGGAILAEWADHAHRSGKPFFLTEFGNMALGWGGDHPGPTTPDAVFSNAEAVIRGLNAGVDAFNRWSFTNRGDMDGQWQLLRTWDRENKVHLDEVLPEPGPYYGFALLARFLPKGADVLACEAGGGSEGLLTAAISESGETTVFVLNMGGDPASLDLRALGCEERPFHHYSLTGEALGGDGAALEGTPVKPDGSGSWHVPIAPRSLSTVSTRVLGHAENGLV